MRGGGSCQLKRVHCTSSSGQINPTPMRRWPRLSRRVLSRYAVDFKSGLEVTFPQDGINVTYVAKPAINLASAVRAARMPPGALRLDVPAAARAA